MEKRKTPIVVSPARWIFGKNNPDAKKEKLDENGKLVKGVVNYPRRKQEVMLMTSYYDGKLKHGTFLSYLMEDGHNATDEEAEKRTDEYLKAWENSNVYQTILSFDNDFIDENISLDKLSKKLMTKIIPQYLKKIGFQDTKKMLYNASLHLDSKSGHYHYHISFAEKEPNYKSPSSKKYMKPKYRRRGKIDIEDLNYLKRVTTLEIKRESLLKDKRIQLNKDIEDIKERFNINSDNFILHNIKDLHLQDQIDELSELIKEERKNKNQKIKFNSLKNKKIKNLTKKIAQELYKDLLKEEKDNFESTLKEINSFYQKLNNSNNVKEIIKESDESENKRKYVDNFVYNAIINNLSKTNKVKLNKEDIVKEIVAKEYTNKNHVPNRKNNIINHLLKKPSNAKIKRSIYSLKEEMEKAAEEFSKSFKVQSYR